LEVLNSFAHLEYISSLLIMRNRFLAVEQYYNHQNQESAHHVHSVSKSFTSALVGIALDEGYLTSLDQKLMEFFPEYASKITDQRMYDITLKHLISMKAGFEWDETENYWREYAGSPDWVEYALTILLKNDPGTRFDYSTPQTNLLSVILAKATGQPTKQFAERYLFGPLRISAAYWYQDPQGYYTRGHEMYFIPRYLIKFGYLYLYHGVFNGKQIVPSNWINQSVQNYASDGASGYGYGWWTDIMSDYSVYAAIGRGGQYILVVPELELIVVTTTEIESWEAGSIQAHTIYVLLHQIIDAAHAGIAQ
jgi:CubicO group peptidase (beta-lactamase class C family)